MTNKKFLFNYKDFQYISINEYTQALAAGGIS